MNPRMVGLLVTMALLCTVPMASGEQKAGDASAQACAHGCVIGQPIRSKPSTENVTTSLFSGYTGKLSYFPGEDIDFHVAAANPDQFYKLFVFREGGARPLMHVQLSELPATVTPIVADAEFGFTWETSTIIPGSVTAGWPSGYYLARLEPASVNSAQFDNSGEYIPFILKPTTPSAGKILVQLPTNTWLAYNDRLGRSYYTTPRTFETSFHRPPRHYWAWINGAEPEHGGRRRRILPAAGWIKTDTATTSWATAIIEDDTILNASNYRLLIPARP